MGKKKNQQTKIESPDQEEQADDAVDKIDISVGRESVPSFQTEEQKVQPLQRKNSKFNLEATASITETKVLYRPEFFH